MLKNFIGKISHKIYLLGIEYKIYILKYSYPNVDNSVVLGDVEFVGKNIYIGNNTYLNKGCTISTGENSFVKIGSHCSIGRYVHITSKTHNLKYPTTDEDNPIMRDLENDTIIGNYVWLGDKVFVREGIKIDDYAVVAANSVVNRDVEKFEIVGGIPIRHIRYNTDHVKFIIE